MIRIAGNELAKVLWFYNLIQDTSQANQKIVCPFHEDVNPSMIVNLQDNSWFCFGCNLAGDAKKFVILMEKKYNGLNDLQAYKQYLKILSSDKCSDIKVPVYSKKVQNAHRIDFYTQAYDYYHGLRKVDWRAPDEQESIIARDYMKARGFSSKALIKCKAKITYNNSYGIIFPMLDNGKFKGWVCRTMNKDIEKKRKYLYNEGFSRATTLVGNYGSKDYVFVVEGYMDRLKFLQYGVDNVVAILGWKMSQQQIDKLKSKGIKTVISALDNDPCGIKGTKFLEQHFDVVRFSYLKGIKDPGETNREQFQKMLNKTMLKLEYERKVKNGIN